MTKRFEVVMNEFDEVEYISDIVDCEDRDFAEFIDFVETVCKENEQLNQFKKQVFQIIDDSIKIYEDTTTNDEFLQIQLDTKLQTLYNLRKELLK